MDASFVGRATYSRHVIMNFPHTSSVAEFFQANRLKCSIFDQVRSFNLCISQFQLLTSLSPSPPHPPPLGPTPREFLEGAKSPPPGKKAAKTRPPGQKFNCEKALKPHPRGRTKVKKFIKDIRSKGTKMGISIKQNHLLKLKYSLHISETVFHIVVLISIDTCITIVLQNYVPRIY